MYKYICLNIKYIILLTLYIQKLDSGLVSRPFRAFISRYLRRILAQKTAGNKAACMQGGTCNQILLNCVSLGQVSASKYARIGRCMCVCLALSLALLGCVLMRM